jgi:hypothetical protein
MTLKPVTVVLDVDNPAMVQQAAKDGRCNDRITKEFLPVGDALVRGDDGRALFVSVGDELKEEVGLLAGDRQSSWRYLRGAGPWPPPLPQGVGRERRGRSRPRLGHSGDTHHL